WIQGVYASPGLGGTRYVRINTTTGQIIPSTNIAPNWDRDCYLVIDASNAGHAVLTRFAAGAGQAPTFDPHTWRRVGTVYHQKYVGGSLVAQAELATGATGSSIALQPTGEPAVSYWVRDGAFMRVEYRRMTGGTWQAPEVIRSVAERPDDLHLPAARTSLS